MAKGKVEIVRVKLRDIQSNPYRDLTIYPILEDKVARLIESIKKTGVWENVIGRRKGKKVEIAYGHHRLEATLRLFERDDTIPIIIKDLSDDDMLDMMIRENTEEYNCPIAAIDDSVKATRDRLKTHPAEARKPLTSEGSEVKRARVGAPMIAKRTGFPVGTVERSLERLGWIERGEVDREALYKMPSAGAADRFAKVVMEQKLSLENQRAVAKRLVKDRRFGEESIWQTIIEFVPTLKKTDPRNAAYYDTQLRKATRQINDVILTLSSFDKLNQVTLVRVATVEDISQASKENYNQAIHRLSERVKEVGKVFEREPLKPILEEYEAIGKHGK